MPFLTAKSAKIKQSTQRNFRFSPFTTYFLMCFSSVSYCALCGKKSYLTAETQRESQNYPLSYFVKTFVPLCGKKNYTKFHEGDTKNHEEKIVNRNFFLGVPLRVGSSVTSPRSFLAPGFPLQPLTQCGVWARVIQLIVIGRSIATKQSPYKTYNHCHCESRTCGTKQPNITSSLHHLITFFTAETHHESCLGT